jgi:hypothetical protein
MFSKPIKKKCPKKSATTSPKSKGTGLAFTMTYPIVVKRDEPLYWSTNWEKV